jgi:hypothetical protein
MKVFEKLLFSNIFIYFALGGLLVQHTSQDPLTPHKIHEEN